MTSNIYKKKNDNFYKKKKNINNHQSSIKVKTFRSTKDRRKHRERRKKNATTIDIYKDDIFIQEEMLALKMCIDEEDGAFLVAIGTIPNDDSSMRK